LKKLSLKAGLVALLVVTMHTAAGSEALAWGPVAHQKIVAEARDGMAESEIKRLWVEYPQYMYGGAIAPDWCLAYAEVESSSGDADEVSAHQGDFHSPEFLEAMAALADTDWEKAFYYAYRSHVVSDGYEEEFGAEVKSNPGDYALEFYVDRMLLSDGYGGEVDIKICAELMVAAYQLAFPDSVWQPTVSQVSALYGANWVYQALWLPYLSEIDVEKGFRYYSGYTGFIDASIQATSALDSVASP
jgi:hypothetical protein